MASKEITLEEIARLPHQAKIAFAARCARIDCDEPSGFAQPKPRKELKNALTEAERFGAIQSLITREDKEKLDVEKLKGLGWSGDATFRGALGEAIFAAVQVAISKFETTSKDQEAARLALEAYHSARHAAKLIHADDAFLTKARESLERLLNRPDAPPTGAAPPEFFK